MFFEFTDRMRRRLKYPVCVFTVFSIIFMLFFMHMGSVEVFADGRENDAGFASPGDMTMCMEIPGNSSVATASDPEFLPQDAPVIQGSSAMVMDMDDNTILYEKSVQERYVPGGLVKLVSAFTFCKTGNPDAEITATENDAKDENSILNILPGESFRAVDLMDAMVISGGAEASVLLAKGSAGSEKRFVREMNQAAEAAGAENSSFSDASGYSRDSYTTSYDMCRILQQAYSYDTFRNAVDQAYIKIPATNLSGARELWSQNRMLYLQDDAYYQFSRGGRLGVGDGGTYNFCSFAEKEGRQLVLALFGEPSADQCFQDAELLFDFSFQNYKIAHPLSGYAFQNVQEQSKNDVLQNFLRLTSSEQPFYDWNRNFGIYARSFVSDSDFEIQFRKKDSSEIEENNRFAGDFYIFYDGQEIAETPVYVKINTAASETNADEKNFTSDKDNIFQKIVVILILILLAGILILGVLLIVMKKKKNQWKKVKIHYHPSGKNVRVISYEEDQETEPENEKKS